MALKLGKKNIIRVGLAVLTVLVILAGAYFFWPKDSGETQEETRNTLDTTTMVTDYNTKSRVTGGKRRVIKSKRNKTVKKNIKKPSKVSSVVNQTVVELIPDKNCRFSPNEADAVVVSGSRDAPCFILFKERGTGQEMCVAIDENRRFERFVSGHKINYLAGKNPAPNLVEAELIYYRLQGINKMDKNLKTRNGMLDFDLETKTVSLKERGPGEVIYESFDQVLNIMTANKDKRYGLAIGRASSQLIIDKERDLTWVYLDYDPELMAINAPNSIALCMSFADFFAQTKDLNLSQNGFDEVFLDWSVAKFLPPKPHKETFEALIGLLKTGKDSRLIVPLDEFAVSISLLDENATLACLEALKTEFPYYYCDVRGCSDTEPLQANDRIGFESAYKRSFVEGGYQRAAKDLQLHFRKVRLLRDPPYPHSVGRVMFYYICSNTCPRTS